MSYAVMSSQEATQCLNQMEDRESKRKLMNGEKNPAITFMKDVKNSLLFKYDWARMLSAAPLSMSLMGACYLAAGSSKFTISLKEAAPVGGFRYLKYPTLKASLVQVSDTGRLAFITAEAKMSMVSSSSLALSQLVNGIIECIGSLPHPAAAMSLQSKLTQLKNGSDDCCQYTKDTEKAFTDWLKLVMELHQVSVHKHEITGEEEANNVAKIAANTITLDLTKNAEKQALEAAKTMKEDLEMTKKAFKKASGDCPTGWDGLLMGVADSFAKTATTVMNQGVTRMLNPIHWITGGPNENNTHANYSMGIEQREETGMDDPAFALAGQISTFIGGVSSLITSGTGGGVHWESASSLSAKNGLTFLLSNLTYHQQYSKFNGGVAGTMLKSSIDGSLEVLKGIKEITDRSSQISSELPEAYSPKVRGWQEKVKEIKSVLLSLEATAASFAGNSSSLSAKSKKSRAPAKTDPVSQNAALANATERLKITESAYMNTQDSYREANEKLGKVQSALGKIQGELKQLNLANATLADVKKILAQCMGVLVDLKEQISNLVLFFTAISCMVEHVIKNHVTNFVEEAKNAKEYMMELGGTSLADFQRQTIYSSCLMVRAYFSLIQTIANMYTEVSRDYIMKGLRMCDELSKATTTDQPQSVIREKNEMLDDYARDVQFKLCRMVSQKQSETSDQLQRRAEVIAAEINYIPKRLVAVSQAAIEKGGRHAAESNIREIEDHGNTALEAGKMEFPSAFDDDDI